MTRGPQFGRVTATREPHFGQCGQKKKKNSSHKVNIFWPSPEIRKKTPRYVLLMTSQSSAHCIVETANSYTSARQVILLVRHRLYHRKCTEMAYQKWTADTISLHWTLSICPFLQAWLPLPNPILRFICYPHYLHLTMIYPMLIHLYMTDVSRHFV